MEKITSTEFNEYLHEGEEGLLQFTSVGVSNNGNLVSGHMIPVLFTDRRLFYKAKELFVGWTVKTVSYDSVNDVTIKKGWLTDSLEIDTVKERVGFSFAGSNASEELFATINEIIDTYKAKKNAANVPSASSPLDKLKKLKELLDMDIISQEEFDAKKKQLLGL